MAGKGPQPRAYKGDKFRAGYDKAFHKKPNWCTRFHRHMFDVEYLCCIHCFNCIYKSKEPAK